MELNPSWEATSCSATQEFPNILLNQKVYYHIHKSHAWAKSIQSTPPHPISLRSILILSSHRRLRLPTGLFPPGFPIRTLCAFLFSPHACYMPCPSHPNWLDHSNYIWQRVQVMKLLITQFSPTSYYFICHYLLAAQFNDNLHEISTILTSLNTADSGAPSMTF
jgi:hypothetical protein